MDVFNVFTLANKNVIHASKDNVYNVEKAMNLIQMINVLQYVEIKWLTAKNSVMMEIYLLLMDVLNANLIAKVNVKFALKLDAYNAIMNQDGI